MTANFAGLLLVQNGVQFIVVGGGAAIAHGSARLTSDVDVVHSRSRDNISRLCLALQEHKPYLRGAPPNLPFRWTPETIQAGLNFTLSTDLGDLDLLGCDNPDRETPFKRLPRPPLPRTPYSTDQGMS